MSITNNRIGGTITSVLNVDVDGVINTNEDINNPLTSLNGFSLPMTTPGTATGNMMVTNGTNVLEWTELKTINGVSIIGPGNIGFEYEIGEYVPAEGGIIFYRKMNGSSQEYLVVDIDEVVNGAIYPWATLDSATGATSYVDGQSNTATIVSSPGGGAGTAAYMCSNLTHGGKTDWYLPALGEMTELYKNYFEVTKTLVANGGHPLFDFAGQVGYLTSTEASMPQFERVYYYFFNYIDMANKQDLYGVRAIRKFTI